MKKLIVSMSLFVAMIMTSCTKEEVTGSGSIGGDATQAYVSLAISTGTATRAAVVDGGTAEASDAENQINTVALLTFDERYNFISTIKATSNDLEENANGDSNVRLFSTPVSPKAKYFFVIANYDASSKLAAAIGSMSGMGNTGNPQYDVLKLSEQDVLDMSKAGKFVMVNEGELVNGSNNPFVTFTDAEISTSEANPTEVTVNVDRILSKFDYVQSGEITSALNPKDHIEVLGVKLNATNTGTYAYSEINKYTKTNGHDYRTDPNMILDNNKPADGAVSNTYAGTELNWLVNAKNYNKDNGTYDDTITPDEERFGNTTEYVLENTCDPNHHDYNNLTQTVVKVVYTPAALPIDEGDSWFSLHTDKGDIEMGFTEVQQYYNDLTDADVKAQYDEQLNHILTFSKDDAVKTTAVSGNHTWATVTLDMLDAVPYGGYRAATAPNYYFKYFQHSINYYDIFIQHDSAEDVGFLGRWGMVRNNSYTLNINELKNHGLPYIPSPFDPDITDPENPDPETPEPADKENGYIRAEIVVNPWTTWTQDSDLE